MSEVKIEKESLVKKIKKQINPTTITVIAVTPLFALPIVLGWIWAYKKYIKK